MPQFTWFGQTVEYIMQRNWLEVSDSLTTVAFVTLGVIAALVLMFDRTVPLLTFICWVLIVLAFVAVIAELFTWRSYRRIRGRPN